MKKTNGKKWLFLLASYILALGTRTAAKHKCKHKEEDSNECECPIQPQKETGLTAGENVGLMLLGLVIGAIATTVVCVCVPSLHSRASIIRGKMIGRFRNRPRSREERYETMHDLDNSVSDNALPQRTTTSNPAAPVSSAGPDQSGYQALNAFSKARDSHTYTGLQTDNPGQQKPVTVENRYAPPDIQPIKGSKTVVPEVSRDFTDKISPTTRGNPTKYNVNNGKNHSNAENQSIRTSDTHDDTANHSYFVLEAQNEGNTPNLTDNGRPVSDHQYFVLEKQNGKQASTDNKGTTDNCA